MCVETDSFFWQLLKQLPETLFALLGLPAEAAAAYRFDSVEIKKSYRLDGLCVPVKAELPVYFVEVQFRRARRFYANLFAKVFSYLEANDPNQDWQAVALFANRAAEPKPQPPYQDLLASPRVRRIYLDELAATAAAAPGLTLLQLVTAPEKETPAMVARLLQRESDSERAQVVVELLEELLLRRFTQMDREEVRRMFQLHDLRKSRVWQEAHDEGIEKGLEKGLEKGREKGVAEAQQKVVQRMIAKGKPLKEIAEMVELPLAQVRRLARR